MQELSAQSIQDVSIVFPGFKEIWLVLSLQAGFNSAVVVVGAMSLGIAAGIVGTFTVLRKRALVSDALAHSALPGLALAFIIAVLFGYDGKSLPLLLFGASCSGVLGVLTVTSLTKFTRLEEDVAIGVVLSVFFGAGVVLLSLIQTMETGTEGGLGHFIYGQTASLRRSDAITIALLAVFSASIALLFLKEFRLICFDHEFAKVQGWPVTLIDLALMSLVVLVTVIGLQTVGLILIVSQLIIPASAARFWTEKLDRMILLAGLIGGASGYLGASLSALLPRLPAGSVIVLTSGVLFIGSFLFAPRRGLFAATLRQFRLKMRIGQDHVLRDAYEAFESLSENFIDQKQVTAFDIRQLRLVRAWSLIPRNLLLSYMRVKGLLIRSNNGLNLSVDGWERATELTRNHRLWEEYLVNFGSINPSHVDYSADIVEHVLSKELIGELEQALSEKGLLPSAATPSQSVHDIDRTV